MERRRFRFTRKTALILLAVLLAIAGQAVLFNFILKDRSNPLIPVEQDLFTVTAQNLSFDIDAGQRSFRSSQVFNLRNSATPRQTMTFLIHPDLAIDRLEFNDAQGMPLLVTDWRVDRQVQYPRWYGTAIFNLVSVQFAQLIVADQSLSMRLETHLKPEGFQSGLGKNLYEFFVSRDSQHAVGFESGAFPVIAADGAAPLVLTLRYPDSELCAAPGNLMSSQSANGFTTVTYQVARAYDPAFSCAAYRKEGASQDGLAVEFYLPPGQAYSQGMGSAALWYLAFYRQRFGDPGTDTFRFIFIPLEFDLGGGGENKGNAAYLGKTNAYDRFDQDPGQRAAFLSLVGHELFHNWNTFYAGWSGRYSDWWSEGGANFMNIWASEQLLGKDAAAAIRTSYLESFDHEMGYRSPGTLEYPNNIWKSASWKGEWTLIYQYGALVWEQLRQKIGDQALADGLADFIRQSAQQPAGYEQLIACLERYTPVNVAAFLEQWTTHNAVVDFNIRGVNTRRTGDAYEATVSILVDSDRDYEIFASLGYKTDSSSSWIQAPLHVSGRGIHRVTITTAQEPLEFLVDPERLAPQSNIKNDHWPLAPD